MELKLLDCTLRDGGYVNEWEFGEKNITETLQRLENAALDIIESGFIKKRNKTFSDDFSLYNDTDSAEAFLASRNIRENTNFVAMIMHGDYSPECICQRQKYLKGIRYVFKKDYMNEAFENCKYILSKGFDLYVQPAAISDYSDEEVISLVKLFNGLDIAAFYIVDTFGTMQKSHALRLFYIIDNNLKKGVPIGFHSHNNLQLSFSNSLAIIDIPKKRELYIDTSVLGMGRGAGNLCTELMTQYINENIEKKYDLIPILETMDENIMPIYSKHPWGYSAPYYIAAVNDCHPNYASYLIDRQSLCIKDINVIIKQIPDVKKHLFDRELISGLYLKFQSHSVDDSGAIAGIAELCGGRKALILAPGKSLLTHKSEIDRFIEENSPAVFAINHIPKFFGYDRIFVSNLKRFKSLDDAVSRIKDRLICTSNISADGGICAVNYSDYLNGNDIIYDNSGLMLINVLIKAGVKDIALAGYDGFAYSDSENYFDESLANNINAQRQAQTNSAMIEYFAKVRRNIDIEFITPTVYSEENHT
ncbi:MAG: aldolase catalytic domain-containing protein [Ruminococcus sp.]|nr:aldolase catalytic domain-containing protein [Ruminococcus sp.]